ncbi:aspartyl/asparaginyl beta-hydroxylase domain-containing protein, partial [Acetobacter estunensis]
EIESYRRPQNQGVFRTLHLGLSIPKDSAKCRIEIGGRKQYWAEGKLFIFDDTYTHCVENDTDEIRGILFIQFERPVSGIGRIAQKIFLMGVRYSAFVKDTKAGIERWNARRQGRSA